MNSKTKKNRTGSKVNLKIRLGSLSLDTPVVCASGTFGYGQEMRGLADYRYIGAVITKTVTLTPWKGNPPPRIYETECGVMNSVGLENPGVDVFLKEKILPVKRKGTKFIVSVGGRSLKEYESVVRKVDCDGRADAFEINLSCPNLKLKNLVSQSQKATYRMVKALRKITKKMLFVKITPEVTDIARIAKAVEEGGADAVSLVNTFFSLAVNIETRRPYLGNVYGGYSGPAIKPMSLYRVWKAARNVKIPVIGGGGIKKGSDAVEFILAGAAAVSLGTVNLVYPNSAKDVVEGIKSYMMENNVGDVNLLRGKLIE